jgi:hypothetical protein
MRGFPTLFGPALFDRIIGGRSRTHRVLLATISLAMSIAGGGIALPAAAGAYATFGPPTIYSAAPGLPDGRVYEQVSPADKNGNEAGVGTNRYLGAKGHYALAAADGNSVVFEGTGAMGEATAAYDEYFVAQRSVGGWSTRSVVPRPLQSDAEIGGGTLDQLVPRYLDMSADLSHVMFQAHKGSFATPPDSACGFQGVSESQMYLGLSSPASLDTWLERPEVSDPIEACGLYGEAGAPVGGTPNFSTVYFTYPGTFLPEDSARVPHVHGEGEGNEGIEAWGFYEDREGALREAGVLPDGSLDPFGAVPAASGHGRAIAGNQVSADGSRAFFVSPDPASCGRGNDCAVDPPELYVRENGEKTLLVSRDALSERNGLPVPAPAGAKQLTSGSYVFASPDGSQAFFESDEDLTEAARAASPGAEPKMYDFNVDTGSVTYLPGIGGGEILVSSRDGSSLLFNSEAGGVSLWSAGPGGGSIASISAYGGSFPARVSAEGSVFVFMSGGLPEFNDAGAAEVFRYDVPTSTLSCVSCPPAGITPTGNAELSTLEANERTSTVGIVDERGISADGSRIFFDTPDPLVSQDVDGVRDVYEWENGTVYLLSSGKSLESSYFLDNSENGGDVFFATTDGLVAGDTDNAYDVYDARIPHQGDNPPPAAVPCEGSVCQGPPRVPVPLSAPASATFSGLGNITPAVSRPLAKTKRKSLTSAQRLSAALKACKKQPAKKLAKCASQARQKYAPNVKKSNRRAK